MELNAAEVAGLLSVPENFVGEWAHAGKLPHLDAQGRLRFNRQAILEWAMTCGHPLNLGPVEEKSAGLPPITELFTPSCFHYGVPGRTFAEVFRAAIDRFELPPEADKELIHDLIVSRDKLMTTAIGDGLAIPHLRVPLAAHVSRPTPGVFFTSEPIDMGAPDGKPVHTVFVLLSLTPKQHLKLLARLASVFRQPDFVKLLRERAKAETICEWIQRAPANARNPNAK